jgi:hypothetical protein
MNRCGATETLVLQAWARAMAMRAPGNAMAGTTGVQTSHLEEVLRPGRTSGSPDSMALGGAGEGRGLQVSCK